MQHWRRRTVAGERLLSLPVIHAEAIVTRAIVGPLPPSPLWWSPRHLHEATERTSLCADQGREASYQQRRKIQSALGWRDMDCSTRRAHSTAKPTARGGGISFGKNKFRRRPQRVSRPGGFKDFLGLCLLRIMREKTNKIALDGLACFIPAHTLMTMLVGTITYRGC